jgi:hypothetical protein
MQGLCRKKCTPPLVLSNIVQPVYHQLPYGEALQSATFFFGVGGYARGSTGRCRFPNNPKDFRLSGVANLPRLAEKRSKGTRGAFHKRHHLIGLLALTVVFVEDL